MPLNNSIFVQSLLLQFSLGSTVKNLMKGNEVYNNIRQVQSKDAIEELIFCPAPASVQFEDCKCHAL
jgi:hypothetical protein